MKLTLVTSLLALLCNTAVALPTGVVKGFYWADDVDRKDCTPNDMDKIIAFMENSRDYGANQNNVTLFNPVDHARRLGEKAKPRNLQTCYCNCIPALCVLYPNGCGCGRRLGGPDLTEAFVAAMEEQHAAAEDEQNSRRMTANEVQIAADIKQYWNDNIHSVLLSSSEGLSGNCKGQARNSIFDVTVMLD